MGHLTPPCRANIYIYLADPSKVAGNAARRPGIQRVLNFTTATRRVVSAPYPGGASPGACGRVRAVRAPRSPRDRAARACVMGRSTPRRAGDTAREVRDVCVAAFARCSFSRHMRWNACVCLFRESHRN